MTIDVQRFLRWTRTASVGRRAEAAAALARTYIASQLAPDALDDFETAMTVLLDDGAMEVRLALADAMGTSGRAPQHIILALAADCAPVAALVAEHSPLLLDAELVELIGRCEETIAPAVARRPFVSRAVSAALAEVGSASACVALLENPGARVARFSLDRIIERHGDCPELRSRLLEREDLPLDIRHQLLTRLAASMRDLLVNHAWVPPERADALTRDARERATIAAAFEAPANTMPMLVETLMEAGELTPAFLIRAAASGHCLLFEAALARLAHVPPARVRALVASGRIAGLLAILRKCGLPPGTFPAFAAAAEVLRNSEDLAATDYRRATQIIDAIVAAYEKRPDRELDHILTLLRQFANQAKRAAARSYAEQTLKAA